MVLHLDINLYPRNDSKLFSISLYILFLISRSLSKNLFKTIRNITCTIVGDRNGMVIITMGLIVAVNTAVMIVQQIYQVVIILITIQISKKIYGNKIKFLSIPLLFNLFSALHCAYAILYIRFYLYI